MKKRWILAAFFVLLAWNVGLTITVYRQHSGSEGMTVQKNTVNGYTTDVTETAENTRSSMVTVHTGSSSVSGIIFAVEKETTYVFTSASALKDSDDITVEFASGAEKEGSLVGKDEDTDLALISCKPGFETKAPMQGDSDIVSQGEYVIAMGGIRDESGTSMISFGVSDINGLRKMNSDSNWLADSFETDLKVTSDNQGGALLNLGGELVGMLCATPYDGQSDMGYAVGINEMKLVYRELKNDGKVTRGSLGVSVRSVSEMESYEKNENGLKLSDDSGVQITDILTGSPVYEILKRGDVITQIDSTVISDTDSLRQVLYSHQPQDRVQLTYERDGTSNTVEVVLQ